jgi:uncharacterized protein
MTVEVRPVGVRCNLKCQYCYQNSQRDAGNLPITYDLKTMKKAIIKEGDYFTLFGGEPLLTPLEDLEKLWAWGLERFGRNSIQTNGTLIEDHHIHMFKKYKVEVGMSIDGPGELNDVRWAGTLEKTRQATHKTEQAIERLCREGIPPSLIVTLHKCNATADRLPIMYKWFRYLDNLGVRSSRLHTLEVPNDAVQNKYALTMAENIETHLGLAKLEGELKTLRFDIFEDIENMLRAEDNHSTCVWVACDPYTTAAVQGVEGNGQRTNCGRENKDGIDNRKAETPGYERYIALYYTPREHGGCKGCRFFLMCKGQCPGTAINGDWRSKTEHCELWETLFSYFETKLVEQGITPVSLQPNLAFLEEAMIKAWSTGSNLTMQCILESLDSACVKQELKN